jgi:hypothetical protein
MGTSDAARLAEGALFVWLVALAVLIAWRALTGGINLFGILAHNEQHLAQGRPAAERVQLLVAFIAAVAVYVRDAMLQTPDANATMVTHLPCAEPQLIALFAASHGIYLSGKIGRFLNFGSLLTSGRE